ncbi:MAG: spore coat protein CotJB [Epulopiscium sp.]|nr:spore coat protein CotJB [Candidatus Epulonipiscium sp.]
MPMNEREKLLRQIQQLHFATVDLNLYLDTHPMCQQALMQYNRYTQELLQLRRMYEMKYGPLSNFGYAPSQYPWQWVTEPWPWE